MSFTVNNSKAALNGTDTSSVTISIASGHTIVAIALERNFTGTTQGSFHDSASNAYTNGSSGTAPGGLVWSAAYAIGVANSVTSVSFTTGTAGTNAVFLYVWDITATGTIAFADGKGAYSNAFPTSTDGITTGSLTVTSADALLLGAVVPWTGDPCSIGTGFTADAAADPPNRISEHKAITASAAVTFTLGSAGNDLVVYGFAFQVASGGGPTINTKSISETSTIADIRYKVQQNLRGDPFAASELLTKVRQNTRGIVDPYSQSDLMTKVRQSTRSIQDPISPIDVVTQFRLRFRAFLEGISIADLLTKSGNQVRNILESIALTDTLTRMLQQTRALNEAFSITDFKSSIRTPGGMIDPIVVTDLLSRQAYRNRLLSDAITITDLLTSLAGGNKLRTLNEAISIVDSLATFTLKTRSELEALVIVDAESRSVLRSRFLGEGITITDLLTAAASGFKVRAILESLTVTDQLTRSLQRRLALLESMAVTDANSVVYLPAIIQVLTSEIILSESFGGFEAIIGSDP